MLLRGALTLWENFSTETQLFARSIKQSLIKRRFTVAVYVNEAASDAWNRSFMNFKDY